MVVPGWAMAWVDVLGGAGFLDAGAGEFFAHRDHHELWVHVVGLLDTDCFRLIVLGRVRIRLGSNA